MIEEGGFKEKLGLQSPFLGIVLLNRMTKRERFWDMISRTKLLVLSYQTT